MRPGSSQLDVCVGNYLLNGGELERLLLSVKSHYESSDNQVSQAYPILMPVVADRRQLPRNTWVGFSAPVQDRRQMPCPDALKQLLCKLRGLFDVDNKNDLKLHFVFIARIISALIVGDEKIFVQRLCVMQKETQPHFIEFLQKVPSLRPMFKEAVRLGVQSGDRAGIETLVEKFLNLSALNDDALALDEGAVSRFEHLLNCIGQSLDLSKSPHTSQRSTRVHGSLWCGNPDDNIGEDFVQMGLCRKRGCGT